MHFSPPSAGIGIGGANFCPSPARSDSAKLQRAGATPAVTNSAADLVDEVGYDERLAAHLEARAEQDGCSSRSSSEGGSNSQGGGNSSSSSSQEGAGLHRTLTVAEDLVEMGVGVEAYTSVGGAQGGGGTNQGARARDSWFPARNVARRATIAQTQSTPAVVAQAKLLGGSVSEACHKMALVPRQRTVHHCTAHQDLQELLHNHHPHHHRRHHSLGLQHPQLQPDPHLSGPNDPCRISVGAAAQPPAAPASLTRLTRQIKVPSRHHCRSILPKPLLRTLVTLRALLWREVTNITRNPAE